MRIPGPWTHRAVSANGVRLHVAERGAGELVLLLHGFGQFWWSWRHQLAGLHGYRVVAPDLRGYGDSDKPPRGYDGWTLAGDVAGLIRALGHRRAHLVGHGFGGLLAWTVAALHPRLLHTVTVVGAPHPLALLAGCRSPRQARALGFTWFAQLPRAPERALRGGRAGVLLRAAAAGALEPDVLARHEAAMRIGGVAHCACEHLRWAVRSRLRADGRAYAAALRRPVRVPVLRVHGGADPVFLAPAVHGSARWAPRSRLVWLDGVGHLAPQEAPSAVTALLQGFLDDSTSLDDTSPDGCR